MCNKWHLQGLNKSILGTRNNLWTVLMEQEPAQQHQHYRAVEFVTFRGQRTKVF